MFIFINPDILIGGSFLFAIWVAVMVARILKKKREHAQLKEARDRKENAYFVACHPETGEAPDVGDMKPFVFFVPYDQAVEKMVEYEQLLDECGNNFWKNPEVRSTYHLKTILFMFQDGEFVNEDFEQYGIRVEDEIKADRAKRHADLKKMNGEFYLFAHHGQTITWSNPKG